MLSSPDGLFLQIMKGEKTLILDELQCRQKIDRIAHEINENFSEAEKLFVVGIAKRGYKIAELINKVLEEICSFETILVKIELDKDHPHTNEAKLSVPLQDLHEQSVVLVDDVLNSGKTLIYALSHILKANIKLLKTTTLVDRRHRRYPVRADYVGLTLSTTLQEHISVEIDDSNVKVYLK